MARVIVRAIRNGDPPGRFLRKDEKTGKWIDIGDKKAAEKTSQALREKTNEEREKQRKDPGSASAVTTGISLLPGTTDFLAAAGAMMAGIPASPNVVVAKTDDKSEEKKEGEQTKDEGKNDAPNVTVGTEVAGDTLKEDPNEPVKDPTADIPADIPDALPEDGIKMDVEKSTEEMAAEASDVQEV